MLSTFKFPNSLESGILFDFFLPLTNLNAYQTLEFVDIVRIDLKVALVIMITKYLELLKSLICN